MDKEKPFVSVIGRIRSVEWEYSKKHKRRIKTIRLEPICESTKSEELTGARPRNAAATRPLG